VSATNIAKCDLTVTGIGNNGNNAPVEYKLYQNYPNPFNPSTKIKFDVTKQENVKVVVYDALGKEISVLANDKMNPGSYELNWNASDNASGVYFYKLITESYSETKKMLLVK
jgi:hypothetical protein